MSRQDRNDLFEPFAEGFGIEWLEGTFIPQTLIFYGQLLPLVYNSCMALGARRGDVLRQILGGGLLLVLVGAVLGTLGALAGAKVLQSQLYGLSATDGLTYLLAALPLLATAFVACLLPARRATKVDPIVALRAE